MTLAIGTLLQDLGRQPSLHELPVRAYWPATWRVLSRGVLGGHRSATMCLLVVSLAPLGGGRLI